LPPFVKICEIIIAQKNKKGQKEDIKVKAIQEYYK